MLQADLNDLLTRESYRLPGGFQTLQGLPKPQEAEHLESDKFETRRKNVAKHSKSRKRSKA